MIFYRKKSLSLDQRIAAHHLNKRERKILCIFLSLMYLVYFLAICHEYKSISEAPRVQAKIISINKDDNYNSLDRIEITFEYKKHPGNEIERSQIRIPAIGLDKTVIYKNKIFLRRSHNGKFYQDSYKGLVVNAIIAVLGLGILIYLIIDYRKMERLSKHNL